MKKKTTLKNQETAFLGILVLRIIVQSLQNSQDERVSTPFNLCYSGWLKFFGETNWSNFGYVLTSYLVEAENLYGKSNKDLQGENLVFVSVRFDANHTLTNDNKKISLLYNNKQLFLIHVSVGQLGLGCSWHDLPGLGSRTGGVLALLHVPLCIPLIAQLVKNPPAMQEAQVQFLGRKNPLEKG